MSAVPGSPKVTRCVAKPASFKMVSRTPSAPASAGVTDGQRMRDWVIERASVMPRLNMHGGRRARCVRNDFDLALLVPRRGRAQPLPHGARPHLLLAQWIRTIPVGPSDAAQEIQLDQTPEKEHADNQ